MAFLPRSARIPEFTVCRHTAHPGILRAPCRKCHLPAPRDAILEKCRLEFSPLLGFRVRRLIRRKFVMLAKHDGDLGGLHRCALCQAIRSLSNLAQTSGSQRAAAPAGLLNGEAHENGLAGSLRDRGGDLHQVVLWSREVLKHGGREVHPDAPGIGHA